jgi:hypothetical protein
MEITKNQSELFKKHIALPQDHGSWVFLISPLLIGLFAGGNLTLATPFLILGAFAAFLIRQPVTIAIKAYSGRRSRRELPAAGFWMIVYVVAGLIGLAGLIWQDFAYLMLLAVPGAPVFAWHLYLVSKRAERRQAGVEIVGSGVLALAAPAAYWISQAVPGPAVPGLGSPDPLGWWLFGLTWLQSAASIVHAYLRLQQRELKEIPDWKSRLVMGRRALLYTYFNLFLTAGLGLGGLLSNWLFLPFALQAAETTWGTFNPAVKVRPTVIGVRQLIVSSLFTLLFILTWG